MLRPTAIYILIVVSLALLVALLIPFRHRPFQPPRKAFYLPRWRQAALPLDLPRLVNQTCLVMQQLFHLRLLYVDKIWGLATDAASSPSATYQSRFQVSTGDLYLSSLPAHFPETLKSGLVLIIDWRLTLEDSSVGKALLPPPKKWIRVRTKKYKFREMEKESGE